MSQFENRLVAVMNKAVEPGKVMNALAHMCIGFGSELGKENLELMDYVDSSENIYPNISKMPFIVLRANSSKINWLRKEAINNNIKYSVFTETMTIGTWEDQKSKTAETPEEEMIYYGIALFGDIRIVSEITRKFSLWK